MDQSFIIHWAPINYAPAINQITADVWERQPREDGRTPALMKNSFWLRGGACQKVNITNKFVTCCQKWRGAKKKEQGKHVWGREGLETPCSPSLLLHPTSGFNLWKPMLFLNLRKNTVPWLLPPLHSLKTLFYLAASGFCWIWFCWWPVKKKNRQFYRKIGFFWEKKQKFLQPWAPVLLGSRWQELNVVSVRTFWLSMFPLSSPPTGL